MHTRAHAATLRSRWVGAAVSACMFTALGGCSTQTTSINTWKNPSYAAGPIHDVIVFAARMTETNRRTVEDGLVSALANHGIHATASYTVFPGAFPSRAAAQPEIQRSAYDSVLVSTMRGVSEKTTIEPEGLYSGWGWAWEPAYLETDRYVKFETTLWDPRGSGTMIWSDETQTENPSSARDFVRSLLRNVIPAMDRAGLLPKAPESVSSHPRSRRSPPNSQM